MEQLSPCSVSIFYCVQINSFELGDNTCKCFNGNHFLLSRQLLA